MEEHKEVEAFLPGKVNLQLLIDEAYPLHFVHVSLNDPHMISYTPSDKYGIQDRKIKVKLGKYLTKFFSGTLSSDLIRDYVAAFRNHTDGGGVLFASTSDEIEWVYENGPDSCMKGKDWKKHCGQHPCRIYGYNDKVQLAYITRKSRVTARVIVNAEDKTYRKIYGDSVVLSDRLKQQGYNQTSDPLENIELPIITHGPDNKYLLFPYIDGSGQRFDIKEDETTKQEIIVISSDGEHKAKGTVGTFERARPVTCESCQESVPHTETFYIDTIDTRWCESCTDNESVYGVIDSHGTEGRMPRHDAVFVSGLDQYILDSEADNLGYVYSEALDDYVLRNDSCYTIDSDWCLVEYVVQIFDEFENLGHIFRDNVADNSYIAIAGANIGQIYSAIPAGRELDMITITTYLDRAANEFIEEEQWQHAGYIFPANSNTTAQTEETFANWVFNSSRHTVRHLIPSLFNTGRLTYDWSQNPQFYDKTTDRLRVLLFERREEASRTNEDIHAGETVSPISEQVSSEG